MTYVLTSDTISPPPPHENADTLREVVVKADSVSRLHEAIQSTLAREKAKELHIPNLAEILEKLFPGINDKITHPFAIKERRRERKHKRDRKLLDAYDKVRTFDDLLLEAIERQKLEDARLRSKE